MNPFDGEDAQLPSPQKHLTTALLGKRLRWPPFLTPYMGLPFLIFSTMRLIRSRPDLLTWQMKLTASHIFHQMLKKHLTAPSLVGAYLLTNVCPRILRIVDGRDGGNPGEEFDREALVEWPRGVEADENAFSRSDSQFELASDMKGGDLSPGEYPLISEMGVDRVIEMFTAVPEEVDDASLLETARRFPATVSSVGRVLLDRLQLDTIDAALTIVEQFMATMSDSSFLLITQVSAFPVCERILRLLPDVTVAQQFTPLWFFLLSMLHVILSIGSRHLTVQVLELAPDVPSIAEFIRAFASWTIEGKAIATLEFLGSLTPLEMSIEVLLLLNESGDVTPIIGLLPQFPFLWPSALTWAIAVSDAQNGNFLDRVRQPATTHITSSSLRAWRPS